LDTLYDKGLVEQARACWENGRSGRSNAGLVQARALLKAAKARGDLHAMAEANRCIGWFCLQLGYCDEGLAAAHDARNFYAGRDEHWGHALSLAVYSWLLAEAGLSDLSFESSSEAVVIAARTGDLALNSFAMNCKAVTLVLCQEFKLALTMMADALDLAKHSGDMSTVALSHINTGYARHYLRLQQKSRDPAEAEALAWQIADDCQQGAAAARSIGDFWNLRVALANGAEIYADLGELQLAQACIDEYDTLPPDKGPRERIHYLYSKSDVHALLGQHDKAHDLLLEAYDELTRTDHHDHRANLLRRLAEVKARIGHFEDAYRYHCAYHDAYVADSGELSRRRAHAMDRQLENDKLREQAATLEAQAGEDPLTGIPNRRAFDKVFAALSHSKAAIGVLDIDYFKQVNDQYSHQVGDAVLTLVAHLISHLDPAMRVYRIGGEEFGLIFEGLSLERAEPVAQRALDGVRALDFSHVAKGLRVTVSIGLAENGVLSGSSLLAEADRRLYVAKKLGRDRIISDSRLSIAASA